MIRLRTALPIIIAAVVGAIGGYWFTPRQPSMPVTALSAGPAAAAEERTILYYRDPTGAPYWSAVPKKDTKGRDYLPVYSDEEQSSASQPKKPQVAGGERKVRYYRNPMGLPDTSPVPKKDSMGMDYIPVYEDDDQGDDNTIKVSVDRVQRSGVRTENVQLRTLVRPVRAPGIVRLDESKQTIVTLRAEGYIEQLHVNTTGETLGLCA
jgi:Cu(I)/Ag(I) efflux system membrane fusion protein